jgi:hypothetical protein
VVPATLRAPLSPPRPGLIVIRLVVNWGAYLYLDALLIVSASHVLLHLFDQPGISSGAASLAVVVSVWVFVRH